VLCDVVEDRNRRDDAPVGVSYRGGAHLHGAGGTVAAQEVDFLFFHDLTRTDRARQRPLLGVVRPPVAADGPVLLVLVDVGGRPEGVAPDPLHLLVAQHELS
jgi:hypothetical protein